MTNKIVFVVIGEVNKNLTLTSLMFDYYGKATEFSVITADSWRSGYNMARAQGNTHALFVSAGTVFTDLKAFLQQLENYPNYGLVGHIVDPLNHDAFWLHQQCLYLDLSLFDADDFDIQDFNSVKPVRSTANIHDDYTPLWLKPSTITTHYIGKRFGERLIAKQLSAGRPIVNFNQSLRQYKTYCYKQENVDQYLTDQEEYIKLAENQLWIFNNESYQIYNVHDTLICPASGLYWMFHLVASKIQTIKLVDISRPQIQFAKKLWEEWNGSDYGQFVSDFIKQNNIKHFNLEDPNISKLDRIKLLKPSTLIDRVNATFEKQCQLHNIQDFAVKWQKIKNKNVNFYNRDIVDFLLEDNKQSDVWLSNILSYKYTLLKHQNFKLTNEHHTKT
jgi:hypothetical protein